MVAAQTFFAGSILIAKPVNSATKRQTDNVELPGFGNGVGVEHQRDA
jgi:hypothetical protein